MWRTFGKDIEGNEAKGCSIVNDTKFIDFLTMQKRDVHFHLQIASSGIANKTAVSHPQSLYTVLYYNKKKKRVHL